MVKATLIRVRCAAARVGRALALLVAVAIPLVNPVVPAALAQTRAERIHELMAHYYALGRHHGAVLVAQGGEVVYEGGFGPADATWGIPNAPDVRYGIGSVTKTFTALLVMQQVERGALRLDAPVADYLPDFPAPIDERITLEHLLTHRAGLVDYVNDLGGGEYTARYEHRRVPADSVVADMARRPLKSEPGQGYDYSNTDYVFLGLLLEAVTDKPYCVLLQEEVFGPAGMEGSGCLAFEPVVPRLATPYEKDGGLTHAPFFHANYADGVVYSTVRDLLRFDQFLLEGRLLSPEMQALMNTPRVEDDWIGDDYGPGLRHFYGYGVETHRRPGASPSDSVTVVGHGGGYTGWSAMLWRVPEDGVVIAVLNNRHIPPLYPELFDVLYDRAYRLPTEEELDARDKKWE
jgi:CubicO group peptidase (beta-lactamase class C family)